VTVMLTEEQARKALEAARDVEGRAAGVRRQVEVSLLRAILAGYAERYPTIAGFAFSSHHEYDDQSSYYWYTTVRPIMADGYEPEDLGTVPVSGYGDKVYQYPVADRLHELVGEEFGGEDGVRAWRSLIGKPVVGEVDGWGLEGSISSDDLRDQRP